MNLDNFIDNFFGNIMSNQGIEKIKDIIEKDMNGFGYKYNTAKVECQIFENNENFDPTRVEISSEGYSDGEIIFLDYYLD